MLYDPNNVNDYWHPWNQYGYHGEMDRLREQQRRRAFPPPESTTTDAVTLLICVYAAVCFGIAHLITPMVGGVLFCLGVEGAAGVWVYRTWRNRRS